MGSQAKPKDTRKRDFTSPGNYRRPNDRKPDETHHIRFYSPKWLWNPPGRVG